MKAGNNSFQKNNQDLKINKKSNVFIETENGNVIIAYTLKSKEYLCTRVQMNGNTLFEINFKSNGSEWILNSPNQLINNGIPHSTPDEVFNFYAITTWIDMELAFLTKKSLMNKHKKGESTLKRTGCESDIWGCYFPWDDRGCDDEISRIFPKNEIKIFSICTGLFKVNISNCCGAYKDRIFCDVGKLNESFFAGCIYGLVMKALVDRWNFWCIFDPTYNLWFLMGSLWLIQYILTPDDFDDFLEWTLFIPRHGPFDNTECCICGGDKPTYYCIDKGKEPLDPINDSICPGKTCYDCYYTCERNVSVDERGEPVVSWDKILHEDLSPYNWPCCVGFPKEKICDEGGKMR